MNESLYENCTSSTSDFDSGYLSTGNVKQAKFRLVILKWTIREKHPWGGFLKRFPYKE